MAKSSNNILALGVGLNLDPLNNDIVTAANTAKDGMDKIGQSVVNAGAKADKPLKETRDKVISLSAQMRQARLDAQQLALGGKELGEAFQASVAKAASLKDQIAAVDQAIMANSTTIQNVGQPAFQTAKSGYNGMAMSINQLTREMPAFTYSMQTGFMAISNNIPMFVDQINAAKIANQGLAASGAPVKSILGQIASSLFSWQTLMGVGITVLTVYGAKIYDYFTATKKTSEAVEQAAKIEKQYSEQVRESKYQLVQKTIALRDELSALQQGISSEEYAIQKKNKQVANLQALIKQYDDYNKSIAANNEEMRMRKNAIGSATDNDIQWGIIQEKNTSGLKTKIALLKDEIEQGKIQLGLNQKITQIKDSNKAQNIKDKIQTKELRSVVLSNDRPLISPQLQPSFKKAKVFDLNFEAELLLMQQGMESASEKMQEINKNMWAKLANIKEQGLNNVFGSIGEALGSTLAKSIKGENTDMFGALRDAMLISIADMAISVGTALVAAGVALAIDPTTSAMTGAYTKIAAGTALIAAGSLAKGLIKSGSSSSSPSGSGSVAQSSFSQGANMNSNFTSNQGNTILINGMIKGNDIQLVNGRNDKKFNRNFNFG